MFLSSLSMRRFLPVFALAAMVGMSPSDGPQIPDRIEEDWQVVIATPNPNETGPQLTTCMSPNSDPSASFVTFYLNYRDHPRWTPGGMQVKAYGPMSDPTSSPPLIMASSLGGDACDTPGEAISWTQRISLSNGVMNYAIVDGQSATWGKFGQGEGTLNVTVPSTLSDLSLYSPDYTMKKSGVSWQSNRVQSMTLSAVRYYKGMSLIATDTSPRSVNLTPGD